MRIHDITAARIERTEGSVVIHVSEAALIIGASLLVGAILAIIVIGIFIGASLGALGVVLYGAAIITGALKLLEHLIIKEDQ